VGECEGGGKGERREGEREGEREAGWGLKGRGEGGGREGGRAVVTSAANNNLRACLLGVNQPIFHKTIRNIQKRAINRQQRRGDVRGDCVRGCGDEDLSVLEFRVDSLQECKHVACGLPSTFHIIISYIAIKLRRFSVN
jgi:hypothetical protein